MNHEITKTTEQEQRPEVYQQLSDKWYKSNDHAMALFREQCKLTTPWILGEIRKNIGYGAKILDISCGAGFFATEAAKAGHVVNAMDISEAALKVAKMHDSTQSIIFVQADPYKIPYSRNTYDVVVGLDLLGNVSDPQQIFFEASRILKPGGIFFYQATNKNLMSKILIGKFLNYIFNKENDSAFAVPLFRKPQDVREWIDDAGMELVDEKGLRPIVTKTAFWQLPWSHKVNQGFEYQWTHNLHFNYVGYCKKLREQ